jgi:hypothetical protein
MIMSMTKICRKCLKEQEIRFFSKKNCNSDGYQHHCKNCCRNYQRNNPEIVARNNRKAYLRNQESRKEIQRNYTKHNSEKIRIASRARYLKNRASIIKKNYERKKRRLATDPLFRVICSLRGRIRAVVNGQHTYKANKSMKLIGCTPEKLKLHLESQFKGGMTWTNYGYYGWHIDHIIPCDSFDLSKPEEQKKCFHYTNLQPLWALDNLKKSNKIV